MLHIDYNCKKCPTQEKATICAAKRNTTLATVEFKTRKEVTESASFKKGGVHLKSPELAKSSPHEALTVLGNESVFFAQKIDDRSIRSAEKGSSFANLKAKFLLPLLAFHIFSQTPGVGSASQPFAQFVISSKTVAAVPPAALKFS